MITIEHNTTASANMRANGQGFSSRNLVMLRDDALSHN